MKIYISFLFASVFYSMTGYSQVHRIFREDTLYTVGRLRGTMPENTNRRSGGFWDFREKLSDGEWIMYNASRKDSSRKDLNKFISDRGFFKDSLREGMFAYHYTSVNGKNIPLLIYNYKGGLLDGYYISKMSDGSIHDQGSYKAGKKHGFFIDHRPDGCIPDCKEVELYENDTLKQWSLFRKGILIESGFGTLEHLNGEYCSYDTAGVLIYQGFFSNGALKKLYHFKDGKKYQEMVGEFKKCRQTVAICNNPIPENGVVKTYQGNSLIRTETYINGVKKE